MPAAPNQFLTGLHEGRSALSADFRALALSAQQLTSTFNPLFTGLQSLTTATKIGAAAFTGLVYFGARGTAEMNKLTFELQRAARELTGAFAPAIRKVVDGITMMADRLRALTGPQQELIRNVTLTAAAVGGVAIVFTKLVTSLAAFKAALDAARVTQALRGIGSPGGTGLGMVGIGISAVAALLTATEEGREALRSLFEALKPFAVALAEAAKVLASVLAPIIKALSTVLGTLFNAVAPLISALGHVVGWLFKFAGALIDAAKAAAPGQGTQNALLKRMEESLRNASDEELKERLRQFREEKRSPEVIEVMERLLRERGIDPGEGKTKTSLTMTAGGPEDPREILRRIQVRSNQTDWSRKTAENTTTIMQLIMEMLRKHQEAQRPRPEAEV